MYTPAQSPVKALRREQTQKEWWWTPSTTLLENSFSSNPQLLTR
jgi:hypothetical protein